PINSGSGQAAATMPIMAVLADALDVSRQTAVLAYQYGDGLSNSLWPSSGVLMASLSIAGIPYEKWLKFVLKIILVMYLVVIAMTMVSVVIGYQ
ncbi:MAG: TIGR00366 family protein, partial [Firmicutes bacterium]|nr:TIGR00366 family protein [Bacillota bacterium]